MHMLLGWPAATKIKFWGFTGSIGSVLKSGLLPSLLIGFRGSCSLTSPAKKANFMLILIWSFGDMAEEEGWEGEKVLMSPSHRLLIRIGWSWPHCSLLENELMKTLCIYTSPHIFFLFFFNLECQTRVGKCSFSYGVKTPACLVLTLPA